MRGASHKRMTNTDLFPLSFMSLAALEEYFALEGKVATNQFTGTLVRVQFLQHKQ